MARTTVEDIRSWWPKDPEVSHMLVACDTFDHEDYPVYVRKGESVRDKLVELSKQSMTEVHEVYSTALLLGDQLAERRAWHPDE